MDGYEVLLFPYTEQDVPGQPQDPPVRSAFVRATGETGVSGYPRYAGDGVQAEVDPETRAVEAITVDGAGLEDGWTARVADA